MGTKSSKPIAQILEAEDANMIEVSNSGIFQTIPLPLIMVLLCQPGMAMISFMDDEVKFSEQVVFDSNLI